MEGEGPGSLFDFGAARSKPRAQGGFAFQSNRSSRASSTEPESDDDAGGNLFSMGEQQPRSGFSMRAPPRSPTSPATPDQPGPLFNTHRAIPEEPTPVTPQQPIAQQAAATHPSVTQQQQTPIIMPVSSHAALPPPSQAAVLIPSSFLPSSASVTVPQPTIPQKRTIAEQRQQPPAQQQQPQAAIAIPSEASPVAKRPRPAQPIPGQMQPAPGMLPPMAAVGIRPPQPQAQALMRTSPVRQPVPAAISGLPPVRTQPVAAASFPQFQGAQPARGPPRPQGMQQAPMTAQQQQQQQAPPPPRPLSQLSVDVKQALQTCQQDAKVATSQMQRLQATRKKLDEAAALASRAEAEANKLISDMTAQLNELNDSGILNTDLSRAIETVRTAFKRAQIPGSSDSSNPPTPSRMMPSFGSSQSTPASQPLSQQAERTEMQEVPLASEAT